MTQRRVMVLACSLVLLSAALLLSGCGGHVLGGPGGRLAIRSQSDPGVTLTGGFEHGYYQFEDRNNLRVVLFDGPLESPTQVAVITMFWNPRAGRTPIDATATNATVQYLIFSGEDRQQVGVYSGAGFVHPKGSVGGARMSAGIWEATLRLVDRSDQFQDLLGSAVLAGSFNAKRDDVAISQMLRRVNIMLRERLGYPRLVRAE